MKCYNKHIHIAFIVLTSSLIFYINYINHTEIRIQASQTQNQFSQSPYTTITNQFDCSCLNNIYDEIFVISIKDRMDTLRLTLFQLNDSNINYQVWEGHSSNNEYSIHLWHQFKKAVDNEIQIYENKEMRWAVERKFDPGNNLYFNKKIFFLRQTQIDIIKYSKKHKLNKILVLEDDILLANPYYINLFCEIESSLPNWYVLNLGTNQYPPNPRRPKTKIKLLNISNFESSEMKYIIKNENSYGAYAISISFNMYKVLLNIFDKQINLWPFDNYHKFIQNENINNKLLNIHPTLVLPDVTTSTLRTSRNQRDFIAIHTTDHNESHFSKYWHLRFNQFHEVITNSPSKLSTHKNYINILIAKTITFENINSTIKDINLMSLLSFNKTHNISIDWIIFVNENKTYTQLLQLKQFANSKINNCNVKLIYKENKLKTFFWKRYLKPKYISNYTSNNYDYIWLMDGNIVINEMNWNCFWYNIHEIYKPSIFQPSILYKSNNYLQQKHKYERITLYPTLCYNNSKGNENYLFGYETSFIEIQTSIFTLDAWNTFITEFNKKTKNIRFESDYSPDYIWCNLINDKLLFQNRNITFNENKQHIWNEETCDIVYDDMKYMNKEYNIPCMIVQSIPVQYLDTSDKTNPMNIWMQNEYINKLFDEYITMDHNMYYRAFKTQSNHI